MPDESAQNAYLKQLQTWRNRRDRTSDLGFIRQQFKREHEKPYKQVQSLVELWQRFIPAELIEQTRLDGFSRGVLRVVAANASVLYEIDRLLRGGVTQQMIRNHRLGTLRRVQLRVGRIDGGQPGATR